MSHQPEELLGYDAISELTGVSVKTLRAWKARGKLPAPDYVVLTGNPVPAWKHITIAKWWTARKAAAAPEPTPPGPEPAAQAAWEADLPAVTDLQAFPDKEVGLLYHQPTNQWYRSDQPEPTGEPKGNCQQKCCAGTNGTVTHIQEAYGDRWTCSACGHSEYYSIGD